MTWYKPIEHEAGGCDVDHRLGVLNAIFIGLAEPTVACQPGDAPLGDPGQAG